MKLDCQFVIVLFWDAGIVIQYVNTDVPADSKFHTAIA